MVTSSSKVTTLWSLILFYHICSSLFLMRNQVVFSFYEVCFPWSHQCNGDIMLWSLTYYLLYHFMVLISPKMWKPLIPFSWSFSFSSEILNPLTPLLKHNVIHALFGKRSRTKGTEEQRKRSRKTSNKWPKTTDQFLFLTNLVSEERWGILLCHDRLGAYLVLVRHANFLRSLSFPFSLGLLVQNNFAL